MQSANLATNLDHRIYKTVKLDGDVSVLKDIAEMKANFERLRKIVVLQHPVVQRVLTIRSPDGIIEFLKKVPKSDLQGNEAVADLGKAAKKSDRKDISRLVARFSALPTNGFQDPLINEHDVDFAKQVAVRGFSELHHSVWNNRPVAVKVVRGVYERNRDAFMQEVAALALFANSQNLVTIYGYCCREKQDGVVVMEYTALGNLYDFIKTKEYSRLKEDDLKDLIVGIGCGLAFLHELSVVHGDLKSTNVLLTKNLVPKICDFGLIPRSQSCIFATVSKIDNEKAGSCYWRAPETLDGSNFMQKSDVYAFGIVM